MLLAVGIPGCNADRICCAVQCKRRGGRRMGVTAEDVLEALHSKYENSTVRNDLRPFWQKLKHIKADLEGSPESPLQSPCADQQCTLALQMSPSPPLRNSTSLPSLTASTSPVLAASRSSS